MEKMNMKPTESVWEVETTGVTANLAIVAERAEIDKDGRLIFWVKNDIVAALNSGQWQQFGKTTV